jgi:hypothetical protein
MPAPLFMAFVAGIRNVGKSPVFKAGVAGAKSAIANSLSGQRTTITSSGSTTNINGGQVTTSSNNMIVLIGVGLVAAFMLLKK